MTIDLKSYLIPALFAIALSSCKKDVPAPTTPATPGATTAPVSLTIQFTNGLAPFDPAASFQDGEGRTVRITKLRFFAHAFELEDDDSTIIASFPGKIILADAFAAGNTFSLGEMQPGNVHHVHLAVGLDSLSSFGYPDQLTAPAPLNDPDMTWAWNVSAGRIFIKLEGFVDANGNGVEDGEEGFQYHAIGPAMGPIEFHRHSHYDVVAGSQVNIGLQVDLPLLVGGLDLTGMHHDDSPVNRQLLQNLATAIMPL